MGSFEFECATRTARFEIENGEVWLHGLGAKQRVTLEVGIGIRALLARDASLAALFREAITLSREINYCSRKPIEHGEYDEKINAIESRFAKLTGGQS